MGENDGARLHALIDRVERLLPETERRVAGQLGRLGDRLDGIEGRLQRLDLDVAALRAENESRWARARETIGRFETLLGQAGGRSERPAT
ncbi:hypothetical protein FTX61_04210 [Nitriliruptoraceae bacterium ZYF776]|nr:hypothetical protein [Profundirhabdus halotolerans]